MNALDKMHTIANLARAGLSWLRHDTAFASPVPENPRFKSPRDAVAMIGDGQVLAASGLGGNQRASILYWAIRERFERTGHPAGLTVMNLGGHGGRGIAPGTLEELGRPGLCTRFITSHFETFKAMVDLADAGCCELQCLPLGVMALAVDALGRGEDSYASRTGVGTVLDPRVGRGSPVTLPAREQFVTAQGNRLRYRLPKIDVAVFNAPAADRRGNIYVRGCAMIGDSREIARAARRNSGRVIVNVGLLVDEVYDEIFLPAEMVDAVVYYPDTEQTGGVFHRDPWSVLTIESAESIADGLARIRFVNGLARLAPRRSEPDEALARLAATTLCANVRRGARVNIGTGLPEEVCRVVFENDGLEKLQFLVESGVVGGLPASGVYFGAALCPDEIISSAEVFKRCHRRLDATCLGVLQADSQGNVNVSRRGEGARGYIGPGGFIDLAAAAETIVFVSGWMHRGKLEIRDGRLRLVEYGAPKFVERVDEVTFNGPRALRAGKRVFYATHVGLFQLTSRGMELVRVMPGIDIRADILDFSPMRVALPPSGRVPRVPSRVLGDGPLPLRMAASADRSLCNNIAGRQRAGR